MKMAFVAVAAVLCEAAFCACAMAASGVSPLDAEPRAGMTTIDSMETHGLPLALKNYMLNQRKQMREKGFVDGVDEREVVDIRAFIAAERSRARLDPASAQMVPVLRITPASLAGGGAHGIKTLHTIPAGTLVDGGWTGVTRVFSSPKLGLVILEEHDYVLAGGSGGLLKEFVNMDLNGVPGVLTVKRSVSGRWLSELTWVTDRKSYHLALERRVDRESAIYRDLLEFALALN